MKINTYQSNGSAVELPEHNIVFFSAPKVASSSIKKMLYEVIFGHRFKVVQPDGSRLKIHGDFSGTKRFLEIPKGKYDSWIKVTIVRDPVERIISAYTNKVFDLSLLTEKHVKREALDRLELSFDPPLDYFLKNLERYRILSRTVMHHTDPFTVFLGHDLSYFDHVFKFNQLKELEAYISDRTGVAAKLPQPTNRSKVKFHFEALDVQAKKCLLNYCSGDYALLKGYYNPPVV